MRILFLDDQESRYKVFKQLSIGKQVGTIDWAENAKQAIDFLSNRPTYDLVCFDHDLGDEHYEAFCAEDSGSETDYGHEPTGYDVALFVATELDTEKQPGFAAVHSFNKYGSQRITAALTEAGQQHVVFVFPFSSNGYEKVIEHIKKHGN